jgi:hypothetical protein
MSEGGRPTVNYGTSAHRERQRQYRATKEGERPPGGPVMGQEWAVSWAGEGISKEKFSWAEFKN